MARHMALGVSVAIHAGLVLIAMRAFVPDGDSPPKRTPALEIVQADPAMLIDVVEIANRGGGGTGGIAKVEPRPNPRRESPRQVMRTDGAGAISDASLASSLSQLATSSIEGSGGGHGGGTGTGHGRGIGLGEGGVITEQPRITTPATPAAPRASKARRAKLIYPKREGSTEGQQLFVARITVDVEGFVVGAKLVQGNGPYAGQAGGLIFRFRYLPALDDDGHPIRSTFDQEFLVQP